MKIHNCIYYLILLTFITNCGFHLRGLDKNYKLPYKTVYLDCQNIMICSQIRDLIQTQSLSVLSNNPESAAITIKLFNEQANKDPQGYNAAGRISAYILTYQVQVVLIQNGDKVSDDMTFSSSSIMNYNDSIVLAANLNEIFYWNKLHENVINQIINKLIYTTYIKS